MYRWEETLDRYWGFRSLWAVGLWSFLFVSTHNLHADIWVNEIHYANKGADKGEFVEIVVSPASASIALSSVRLSLYNGDNKERYDSYHYLDSFTLGQNVGGFCIYYKEISGIQNGAPDGWAVDIVGDSGSLVEFKSYGGVFTAADGPASGKKSVDIGVAESDSSTEEGYSLQLVGGPGSKAADFEWQSPAAASPGFVNNGQTFTAVPEPSAGLIVAVVIGWGVFRRRCRTVLLDGSSLAVRAC
ncbi:MAG: hypothetical protein KatS3mg111_2108 [Pirellulaceae bacterium]|nr:MAG: hypothetical protein KatS3mg111_2108 [Pirellulaceae bacterium]